MNDFTIPIGKCPDERTNKVVSGIDKAGIQRVEWSRARCCVFAYKNNKIKSKAKANKVDEGERDDDRLGGVGRCWSLPVLR